MSMDVRPIEDHPSGFKDNIVRCFRKYLDGNGRARRREYWWFALFQILVLTVPFAIAMTIGTAAGQDDEPVMTAVGLLIILLGIVYLGLIIPSITVLIRRFHDVGLSGWLILVGIIPLIGGLFTFVVSLLPSQPHPNKHGPVPGQALESAADTFA